MLVIFSPIPSFALTPAADLTGTWSGLAQFSDTGGYCDFTGKVNVDVEQTGNSLDGTFLMVVTSAKSSYTWLTCQLDPINYKISGTIDGSKINVKAGGINFSGWYASSGVKLDFSGDGLKGTTQLSPTNFTPPTFETPKDSDGDGTLDKYDKCPNDPNKTSPGIGGCGISDKDSDGDDVIDVYDKCPNDPNKTSPGIGGCGISDKDSDGDGLIDDHDACPNQYGVGSNGCPEPEKEKTNLFDPNENDNWKLFDESDLQFPLLPTVGEIANRNPDASVKSVGSDRYVDVTSNMPLQVGDEILVGETALVLDWGTLSNKSLLTSF